MFGTSYTIQVQFSICMRKYNTSIGFIVKLRLKTFEYCFCFEAFSSTTWNKKHIKGVFSKLRLSLFLRIVFTVYIAWQQFRWTSLCESHKTDFIAIDAFLLFLCVTKHQKCSCEWFQAQHIVGSIVQNITIVPCLRWLFFFFCWCSDLYR